MVVQRRSPWKAALRKKRQGELRKKASIARGSVKTRPLPAKPGQPGS
jgi:hypothetical protein